MTTVTLTKRISIILLAALFFGACDNAPPPKAVSEIQPVSAAGNTASARRAGITKDPGAVLREKSIQAVNDIELSQSDGKSFKFADLRGKVILVDVWGTWCAPCVKQAPELAALQAKYRERGLAVVGLSLDKEDTRDQVLPFMKKAGINYTVAYANEKISRAFLDGTEDETNEAPIPQLFVISRDGRVIEHLIGNDPRHSIAQLEEVLTKQLN